GARGVRDRAGQEDQGDVRLPHEQRSQLRRGAAPARLLPAHRQAPGGDPGELAAGGGCDHRAGGVRRRGEDALPRGLEGPPPLPAHRPPAEGLKPRRPQRRQNMGENSTSTVKISSRPRIMAADNSHLAKGLISPKWAATSPSPGPILLRLAAVADQAVT